MLELKVNFENGDYLHTKINCSVETAEQYYIGKYFNLGRHEDKFSSATRCTSIEVLNEIK